jgi:hypothetical protein
MKSVASFFACAALTAGLVGFSASPALAAKGEDFPGTTCTCQGCAEGGGDVNGDCASVCKGKTVYSKGSEPYDYCKAAGRTVTGDTLRAAVALAGMKEDEVAQASHVDPATIIRMENSAKKPVSAKPGTVDKVIDALEVKGGVKITEDGVHLAQKPLR